MPPEPKKHVFFPPFFGFFGPPWGGPGGPYFLPFPRISPYSPVAATLWGAPPVQFTLGYFVYSLYLFKFAGPMVPTGPQGLTGFFLGCGAIWHPQVPERNWSGALTETVALIYSKIFVFFKKKCKKNVFQKLSGISPREYLPDLKQFLY